MKKRHISLTDEQIANVEALAKAADLSFAGVIRLILDKYEDEIYAAIKKVNRRGDIL